MQAIRHRLLLGLCALFALLGRQPAFAQGLAEDDLGLAYGDKETVSIATGSKQPLRRAPAVASVVTAEDIVAMGAVDLDQVLETIPGVHVSRTAVAYGPLYDIRGIHTDYNPETLVLLNGVPMTNLLVGNRTNAWGGFPLENVARIEVLRGPGSALYGADAFSGVINIITKSASDIAGTVVGLRGGSNNTWDGWAQYGDHVGVLDVAAYLRAGTTDGIKGAIRQDAQSLNDQRFGTHASLAPGQINTGYRPIDASLDLGYDKWRLRFTEIVRDDVGTGAGISSALDPVGKTDTERSIGDLSWANPEIARDWGAGFAGSVERFVQTIPTPYQLYPPGARFPAPSGLFPTGMIGAPETWERQIRLSGYATYSGFVGHAIRLGLGHDDLDMYKTDSHKNFIFSPSGLPIPAGPVTDYPGDLSFLAPHRRTDTYAYGQDEWQLARDWSLTGGLRYDKYSDFAATANPRLALVWDAALDVTAKLLYGRAFRAPSFNEEYGVNNPVAKGNPDLRPEAINTYEAAVAWQARPDVQIVPSVFHYDIKDLIQTVPNAVANTGATFQNIGDRTGNGFEIEVTWDAAATLKLTGNYAFQRSMDEATSHDAGYAPHHHVYARADWRFVTGWLADGQVNWIADRERAAGDLRPQIPDYTTVDLALRNTGALPGWEFTAAIRNLFDANCLEPSLAPGTAIPYDLPVNPRTYYVQASHRF